MVTLKPSINAPLLDRSCQWIVIATAIRESGPCGKPAVADARIKRNGQWAYLCLDHLEQEATPNSQLITNITSAPLTLDWIPE